MLILKGFIQFNRINLIDWNARARQNMLETGYLIRIGGIESIFHEI